jgi:nitrogen-specific signal transduction histidine kinase
LGERRYFTGIVRDISERKRLEREISDRNEALAAADKSKDEFLAILGHELRNPLAAIRNAVAVLRARGPASGTLHDAGSIVDRQVMQVSRLADDLLDISRADSRKLAIDKERLAIGATIASAVEAVRPLIESAKHELTLALAPQPLYVEADRMRLLQIVQNLLTNAVRYTPPGGKIVLSAARDGTDVVLSVKDNGIGIPGELLPHIFDPFVQGARRAEREGGGLGLGLALVRRLTELHGGSVQVVSDGPGCGAEFTVRLPAVDDDDDAQPGGPAHETEHRAASRRVLVVQRQGSVAAPAVSDVLRLRGDDVHVLYDGTGAMEAADALKPDVVLFDLGFDGYEACRLIREQPWGRRACVVALLPLTAERTPGRSSDYSAPTPEVEDLESLINRLFFGTASPAPVA